MIFFCNLLEDILENINTFVTRKFVFKNTMMKIFFPCKIRRGELFCCALDKKKKIPPDISKHTAIFLMYSPSSTTS